MQRESDDEREGIDIPEHDQNHEDKLFEDVPDNETSED